MDRVIYWFTFLIVTSLTYDVTVSLQCPTSSDAWNRASLALQCKLPNFYHCLKDEKDVITEQCLAKVWIEGDDSVGQKGHPVENQECNLLDESVGQKVHLDQDQERKLLDEKVENFCTDKMNEKVENVPTDKMNEKVENVSTDKMKEKVENVPTDKMKEKMENVPTDKMSHGITEEGTKSAKCACEVYVTSGPNLPQRAEQRNAPQILILVQSSHLGGKQIDDYAQKAFGPKYVFCWKMSHYQKHRQEEQASMLLKDFDFKTASAEEILKKLLAIIDAVETRVAFVVVIPLNTWMPNRENITKIVDGDRNLTFKTVFC